MAKHQTRRSISVSAIRFAEVEAAAEQMDLPVTQFADRALSALIAAGGGEPAKHQPAKRGMPPIADQVIVDDLRADSPFRRPCSLAGCGAGVGQACRPVRGKDGIPDSELEVSRAHLNRFITLANICETPEMQAVVSDSVRETLQQEPHPMSFTALAQDPDFKRLITEHEVHEAKRGLVTAAWLEGGDEAAVAAQRTVDALAAPEDVAGAKAEDLVSDDVAVVYDEAFQRKRRKR